MAALSRNFRSDAEKFPSIVLILRSFMKISENGARGEFVQPKKWDRPTGRGDSAMPSAISRKNIFPKTLRASIAVM